MLAKLFEKDKEGNEIQRGEAEILQGETVTLARAIGLYLTIKVSKDRKFVFYQYCDMNCTHIENQIKPIQKVPIFFELVDGFEREAFRTKQGFFFFVDDFIPD